jgi:putative lipoprotein
VVVFRLLPQVVLRTYLPAFMVLLILLTACNSQGSDTSQIPPVDEASITNVWHKAKLRGVAFRAIGQEPAWLLEITEGSEIMLSADYGQDVKHYPYAEPVVYQEQRRTLYGIDDENIEIEIRGQPCKDVMSGEEFSTSVTIRTADRELRGCGRALY